MLLGGGPGAHRPLGAAMAVGSALFYTVFILASDRVTAHTPPVPFAASVVTGSALAFGFAALLDGGCSAPRARA